MHGFRHFPRKLLALFAALLLLPAGGALASQTYMDTAGDAPSGAPDITQVTISHKIAGDITFQVAFANRSILAGEDLVVTLIDKDQDNSTGAGGDDYSFFVSGFAPTAAFLVPAGSDNPSAIGTVLWASQAMTVVFNKAQIGYPTAFDFSLASGTLRMQVPEFVPHSGELTYSLVTEVAAIQLPKVVTTVKAGKVFSIKGTTVKLTTDEVFTPDTLTAKATAGGKALKPLGGGLSWKVPKAAKGKKLVVKVTAGYQGITKTQSFIYRIVK